VTPKASRASQALPKVEAGSRSSQRLPKVGESRRSLSKVDEDGRRSKSKLQKVETPPPPPGVVPDEPSQRGTEQAGQAPSGGGKALLMVGALLVLALLGGVGWAVTKGPLAGMLEKATKDDTLPVDTGPSKIDLAANTPNGAKPQWLIEKEEQQRKEAEEKARQKEIEEAANDPDRLALLQEITAQIEQLNRLEEEQRQLKIEAKQGKQNTEQNAKKIEDLQKQINDLKEALKEKEERKNTVARKAPGDGVTVVKDSRGAKANELGYLTLKTTNPSSSTVFLGKTELGSTPFVKLPIEAGVHELTLLDSDSKRRTFTVTISAGKTADQKVNVGSLPLGP
jgi:hypothetical protein